MRVGAIVSSDVFYNPDPERHQRWSERGILGVEMEAAMLFTIGALRGVQAGCLLTVSDIVVGDEFKRITDEDLRAAVDQMTELALATVTDEPLAAPSSWSTPRRRTARPAGAGPSSRTGRPRSGSRATRCSPSGPGTCASSRAQAADGGARLLVAVGGDGTVNEVVNGIVGGGVELAVIPRGTGVDFVRTYGIPRKLEGAVEVALRGRDARDRPRRARATAPGPARPARRWFVNVAGVGMSGAVAKRTNETSKALGGKVSYLWSTLAVFARWRNTEVRVTRRRRGAHAAACTRWSSPTAATSAAG